jgi:hypothetical protein
MTHFAAIQLDLAAEAVALHAAAVVFLLRARRCMTVATFALAVLAMLLMLARRALGYIEGGDGLSRTWSVIHETVIPTVISCAWAGFFMAVQSECLPAQLVKERMRRRLSESDE